MHSKVIAIFFRELSICQPGNKITTLLITFEGQNSEQPNYRTTDISKFRILKERNMRYLIF